MKSAKEQVEMWLNQVVIGLNLCPFAVRPASEKRVRIVECYPQSEEDLLDNIAAEMKLLDESPTHELETTLIITPQFLQDFYDYNCFLDWAQSFLRREGWQGVYQLASFHPNYCFAGASPEDDENLTNRSPYPIIHIIREASLTKALHYVDNAETIPERNKVTVAQLTQMEKQKLFPYLFKGSY